MPYFVYLALCADRSYYCGITTDLGRRLQEHNASPQGAKYTRNKRPITLVYAEKLDTRSQALKREYQIKKLSRVEKQRLSNSQID